MVAASKICNKRALSMGLVYNCFNTTEKERKRYIFVKWDWDVCLHYFQLQNSREMYVTVA